MAHVNHGLGVFSLSDRQFFMPEHTMDVFHIVVAWIGIVLFGLGGLYMLYATMKERLTGKLFLAITDEGIISEGVKKRSSTLPTWSLLKW